MRGPDGHRLPVAGRGPLGGVNLDVQLVRRVGEGDVEVPPAGGVGRGEALASTLSTTDGVYRASFDPPDGTVRLSSMCSGIPLGAGFCDAVVVNVAGTFAPGAVWEQRPVTGPAVLRVHFTLFITLLLVHLLFNSGP